MFSIGVIFHILLIGEALFPGKKFNDVLKKNKACKVNLDDALYELLDPLTKDLLSKLLEVDPKKRITADAAISHPYF